MATDEIQQTYSVYRFYLDDSHPDHKKIIKKGLTKEEAVAHCQDPDSMEVGVWFDGWTRE